MRIALWTLLALTLGSPVAAAPPWAEKMFPDGTSHDFGSVPRGTQLFHRFKMTNIYAVPLEIMSTRTSCGCVSVTPAMKLLQPRESGFIDVNMDARRFTNPKTVSIFVTVGPEYTSTATLQVTANSRADVVLNPGEVNFGVVQRGQTPVQTIDVEYAGTLDWKVTEVVKTTAPLEVGLQEFNRLPGQVGYRVQLTLKADAPPGILKQELLLKTNDTASPLVTILVEANVQAPLTVTPGTIGLGTVEAGKEVVKRVVVKGGKPFRILAIEGLGDDFKVELPPQAATVHIITFKCQPRTPGELHRRLTVKTDLDQELTAPIVVEGTVAP